MMSLESKFAAPRLMICLMVGLSMTPFSHAQEKAPATRTQTSAPVAKDASSPAKPGQDDAKAVAEGSAGQHGGDKSKAKSQGPEKKEKTAYDFELPGSDGKGVPLASFKGK